MITPTIFQFVRFEDGEQYRIEWHSLEWPPRYDLVITPDGSLDWMSLEFMPGNFSGHKRPLPIVGNRVRRDVDYYANAVRPVQAGYSGQNGHSGRNGQNGYR